MDIFRIQVTGIFQAGRRRKGPAHVGGGSLWRQISYCAEQVEGQRCPPHLQKGITTSLPERGLILPRSAGICTKRSNAFMPNSMLDNLAAYFPM